MPKAKEGLEIVPTESLVGPNDWVATWSEKKGYTISMPKGNDPDSIMPFGALVLMSAVIRLQNDHDFAMEMYNWMNKKFQELKV
jgi:hypothetical protein